MKSDKNFNDTSTDELRRQLDMLVHQRAQNQARRRGITESIEQLQKYKSELYAEYETLDKEQAKIESALNERRADEPDDADAEDGDEPEVMTDGGVDTDEHVESVFGLAINEVVDTHGVDRDELTRAVAEDIDFFIGNEETYVDEVVVIVLGNPEELNVPNRLRDAVQHVHNQTARDIAGYKEYVQSHDVYVGLQVLSEGQ